MQFKSFFKIFINENWTKRASSKDFRKILTKYANVPDAMYSFRNYVNKSAGNNIQKINPSIGINPNSKFDTPNGIYGYPVEETLDKALLNNLEFASDRPILVVYKPKKNVFVVRASTFSKEQLTEKKFLLAKLLDTSFEEIQEISKLNIDSGYKRTPAHELWSLTRLLSKQRVNTWSKLLIDIGCPIIVDDLGHGIIHPSEPIQCVVFGRQFVDVLEVVENLQLTPETNKQDSTLTELYRKISFIIQHNSVRYPGSEETSITALEKWKRKKDALLINMQPFSFDQKIDLWKTIYLETSLPIEDLKVEKNILKLEPKNKPERYDLAQLISNRLTNHFSISTSADYLQRERLYIDFLLKSLNIEENVENLTFILDTIGYNLEAVNQKTFIKKVEYLIESHKKKLINYLIELFSENNKLDLGKNASKIYFLTKNTNLGKNTIFNILKNIKTAYNFFLPGAANLMTELVNTLDKQNKDWKTDLEKENKKLYDRVISGLSDYFEKLTAEYFLAGYNSGSSMEIYEKLTNDEDDESPSIVFIKKMLNDFPFDSNSASILFYLAALDVDIKESSNRSFLDETVLGKTITDKLIEENLSNDFVKLIGQGFMNTFTIWRDSKPSKGTPKILQRFDNYGIFSDSDLKDFLTTENLKELINYLYINSDWFEALTHNYNTKGETFAERLIYSLENELFSYANHMITSHQNKNLFTKKFIIKLMLNNKEKILENVKDNDFTNGYELKI
jgi:hypothetical protein